MDLQTDRGVPCGNLTVHSSVRETLITEGRGDIRVPVCEYFLSMVNSECLNVSTFVAGD